MDAARVTASGARPMHGVAPGIVTLDGDAVMRVRPAEKAR